MLSPLIPSKIFTSFLCSSVLQFKDRVVGVFSKTVKDNGLDIDMQVVE
jgi:hypothetical protein